MTQSVIVICLILSVVAGLICAMTEKLMKAALALAGLSVLTSIILFLFGAVWAALFELSCCVESGIKCELFCSPNNTIA